MKRNRILEGVLKRIEELRSKIDFLYQATYRSDNLTLINSIFEQIISELDILKSWIKNRMEEEREENEE